MKISKLYKRYRFPAEIIQYAVWLYYRFNLSHRDIEDLLAEKGINVTYAELSHQPTRVRERGMRRFKSIVQAQRFLGVHSAVYNLFNLSRHLISASHYRQFRSCAFASWKGVVT